MTILLLTSAGQDLAQQRARSCPASKKVAQKNAYFYNLITKGFLSLYLKVIVKHLKENLFITTISIFIYTVYNHIH